jgi:hypothetical protein
MGFFRNIKSWLRPKRMSDPDFGCLVFMHIARAPERSYWECEWNFPKTGTRVSIALRGGESGPTLHARQFYLGLPARFEQILPTCRPSLEKVFRDWLDQPLPLDVLSVLRLSGFGVEDPAQQPVHWDISFETLGDKWLGITVPFVDETPMEAEVDT